MADIPENELSSDYLDVLTRLRDEGFRAEFTCIMVPVQLEGHLASGEAFYFRCRHTRCSLGIAPEGGDPVGEPTWREEVSRWDDSEAGYLEPEEAEAVFRELLAAYFEQ